MVEPYEEADEDRGIGVREAAALGVGVALLRKRAIAEMKAARNKADKVLDVSVVRPMRRTYERETGSVILDLSRLFRGKSRRDLTPKAVNQALALLRVKLPQAGHGLAQVLSGMTTETLTDGLNTTATILARVRQSGTPLNDAKVIGQIVEVRQAQLEALRQQTARTLATNMQTSVLKNLQNLPMKDGKISDIISSVGEQLDGDWWRIERTVRTETAYAYSAAQADGVEYLENTPEFHGKLYNRWTEMVNDLTGAPMDKRVGKDSLVLHGQITLPRRGFTMPSDRRAPVMMHGMKWAHPPNRPNDRAVLTPWMHGWGIPAYILTGARKMRL